MKKCALISVTNKTGLIPFVTALVRMEWEIVSTGGTAKAILDAGLPCTQVSEVTGYPEMMDGRVRTLHPKIFGGIIADRNVPKHMEEATKYDINMFGMVVVNLYDFASKPCVNEIDVGGPSMLRAAAKNFEHVIVVVDPDDYEDVALHLELHGDIDIPTRMEFAEKVFEVTAQYDTDIRDHFRKVRAAGGVIELGQHGT